MYVLDFLDKCSRNQIAGDTFEYRLLCSGEIYNSRVKTFDWRKSDVTRRLSDSPFTLFVCSQPFDDFPQELAFRFSATMVQETCGNASSSFYPDEEISRDMAALLTLFCRRLITVAAKVRQSHSWEYEGEPEVCKEWPTSFVKSVAAVHWERKPATVVWGFQGIERFIDYNPPPLGVDPVRMMRWLLSLPRLAVAESVVLSARLYSLALKQLEEDTDIAYQLLFAAAEAMATAALREYTPSPDEMVQAKESVKALAIRFGLSQEQAVQLALEACKGIPWASRKFVKFLSENTTDELWKEDDLFKLLEQYLPTKESYEAVLSNIYIARGKLVHGGQSLPPSSAILGGPTIPVRASMAAFDPTTKPFPPVVWFERVVNHAINTFIDRYLTSESEKPSNSTQSTG